MTDWHSQTMADLVTELLDAVDVRVQWVEYHATKSGRGKSSTTRAATRRDPGLLWQLGAVTGRATHAWLVEDTTTTWTTSAGTERTERIGHRAIRVLLPAAAGSRAGAAVPGGSPGWDRDGALSPSRGGSHRSIEPATAALELADLVASRVASLYALLTNATAARKERRTVGGRLRHMVALVADAERHNADWAVSEAQSWVSAARTLLGYDARLIELASWVCPDCHGRLRTRANDESVIWCAGGDVHGPRESEESPMPVVYGGCGAKWGKLQWIDLMARQKARAEQERTA